MCNDLAARLVVCRNLLLPIWEYWTEGNLAARCVLDAVTQDPLGPEMQRLLKMCSMLRARGRDLSTVAARSAGVAILAATVDPAFVSFDDFCVTAVQVDLTARLKPW